MDKKSILFVDDNINLGKTMELILRRKGYETTVVASGEEALEKIRERTWNTVFMDMKMPWMNGLETYREIAKLRPGIPVVIITAYADDEMIHDAVNEGAYGILYKPLDLDMLDTVITGLEKHCQGSILVIDDELMVCRVLKRMLERQGYSVDMVSQGNEGLELVRQRKYNMYFIDILMPGMNGYELLSNIRKIHPDAFAVMMTGYRDEVSNLMDKALMEKRTISLYKPFEISDVQKIINTVL